MIENLVQSIDYQKGTIVSRVMMKTSGGNMTLFAFSKGEELSEHTAPFNAFVQCLDGKAEIIIDGQSNFLTPGLSIQMPANVPHAVKATEDFKMILTMLKDPGK